MFIFSLHTFSKTSNEFYLIDLGKRDLHASAPRVTREFEALTCFSRLKWQNEWFYIRLLLNVAYE